MQMLKPHLHLPAVNVQATPKKGKLLINATNYTEKLNGKPADVCKLMCFWLELRDKSASNFLCGTCKILYLNH